MEESNRQPNYRGRNEGLMSEEQNKKREQRVGWPELNGYSNRQQFTEQMDQLCGPNYSKREVGAVEQTKIKNKNLGNSWSWCTSGSGDTSGTWRKWQRGSEWPIKRAHNQSNGWRRQTAGATKDLLPLSSHAKQAWHALLTKYPSDKRISQLSPFDLNVHLLQGRF